MKTLKNMQRKNSARFFQASLAVIFLFFLLPIYCADYYWVGNTGNWHALSHWAAYSGGPGNVFATPPTSTDNVIFDEYSFTLNHQALSITAPATCDSMIWRGDESRTPILFLNTLILVRVLRQQAVSLLVAPYSCKKA
jgi:hypothetical protein